MNDLLAVAEVIKKSQRLLLCGHVLPDGDSLGSVLGLSLGLRSIGKEVTVVSSDTVPELYKFLPGADSIVVGSVPEGDYDMLIVVDCSVPDRLGSFLTPLLQTGITVTVIDHHVNDYPFGNYNYIRSQAAATGEIIMDLLDLLEINFTSEIAVNLYTAIITDTGSFRYESTKPDTHRKTARLLEYGVPVAKLSNLVFGEQPLESIRLLGVALNNLKISQCGRVAWIAISRAIIDIVGAKDQHIEGIINYPRKIKGVEVAIVFRELDHESVKVSFRSKYEVDVNLLAKKFGGGGHVRASGCTIKGQLSEVVESVLRATEEIFRGC